LDPETDSYNVPFLKPGLKLLRGYRRMQGIATRADETRDITELLEDPSVRMVNRNRGAGTRILIDRLLEGRKPPGYPYEPRSHYAVAAAIDQGRADWGVTIESVARDAGLRFVPLQAEEYDFVVPESRWDRPVLKRLRALLSENPSDLRTRLAAQGFDLSE
jgi:putative molybdopterin biosynthesis protein